MGLLMVSGNSTRTRTPAAVGPQTPTWPLGAQPGCHCAGHSNQFDLLLAAQLTAISMAAGGSTHCRHLSAWRFQESWILGWV